MWKRRIALGAISSLLMSGGCVNMPLYSQEATQRVSPPDPASVSEDRPVRDPRPATEFRLRLHHLHTGESIDVAYRRGDQELAGGIAMLNHFLRDWRTVEDADYPVGELDLLHALVARLQHHRLQLGQAAHSSGSGLGVDVKEGDG